MVRFENKKNLNVTKKKFFCYIKTDFQSFTFSVCLLFPQLLGLCLSYLFWMKLKDICKYDEVDFRSFTMKDFNFKELDLSGAGCCLCIPREEGYIPINADSDDEKLT